MAIPATQMRPGMVVKFNNDLFSVFSVAHRTPPNKVVGPRAGVVLPPPPVVTVEYRAVRVESASVRKRDPDAV